MKPGKLAAIMAVKVPKGKRPADGKFDRDEDLADGPDAGDPDDAEDEGPDDGLPPDGPDGDAGPEDDGPKDADHSDEERSVAREMMAAVKGGSVDALCDALKAWDAAKGLGAPDDEDDGDMHGGLPLPGKY